MLADPQSVTISGSPVSLPRTGVGSNSADYTSADGANSLRVSQTTKNAIQRTSISLRSNKIAADPLTAINKRLSANVAVQITAPQDGYSVAELTALLVALATALTASSAALATKILGGEK